MTWFSQKEGDVIIMEEVEEAQVVTTVSYHEPYELPIEEEIVYREERDDYRKKGLHPPFPDRFEWFKKKYNKQSEKSAVMVQLNKLVADIEYNMTEAANNIDSLRYFVNKL